MAEIILNSADDHLKKRTGISIFIFVSNLARAYFSIFVMAEIIQALAVDFHIKG
jgi:hypothetical protein